MHRKQVLGPTASRHGTSAGLGAIASRHDTSAGLGTIASRHGKSAGLGILDLPLIKTMTFDNTDGEDFSLRGDAAEAVPFLPPPAP